MKPSDRRAPLINRYNTRILLAVLLLVSIDASAVVDRVKAGPGEFASVLPPGPGVSKTVVQRFELDRLPVTNAQFLAFVRTHEQWRRDRAPRLFIDSQYLAHWFGPTTLGIAALPAQPVTRVSWFAAKAYCESQGARLPTWYEWEFAAAADEKSPDARHDPVWRQHILDWYARPSTIALPEVGAGPRNYYGISDLHGLVWEWVVDFNALLVSNDSREQGGADRAKFCGAGALSMADRENYAVLMRIALLSSLEANSTTANLGFRCAADLK